MMRTTTRRETARRLLVVPLAASLLLAACGDDDADADADAGALDKTEYIAAAEAVCARLDTEGTEIAAEYYGEDFSKEPSADEQAEFFRRLIPQVEAGIAEILALDGPAEGQALAKRVVGDDSFIPDAKRALALYDAGERVEFEKAVIELFTGSGGQTSPALAAEATEYGFSGCVDDGDEGADEDADHSD